MTSLAYNVAGLTSDLVVPMPKIPINVTIIKRILLYSFCNVHVNGK